MVAAGLSRLVALCLCTPALAHAALTLSTRVIYAQEQGEASVQVQYPEDGVPLLMQIWLDDGGADIRPQDQNVPFVVSPAVARIDPGQARTIRILQIRDELPKDRESLFYFNVLEVPPMPVAEQGQAQDNFMQVGIHTRVKFFYRPAGLQTAPDTAVQQLRFALEPATRRNGNVHMRVINPSPYHMTLHELSLHAGAVPQTGQADAPALAARDPDQPAPVIAPMSEQVLPLPLAATAPLAKPLYVRFAAINDYGAAYPLQKPLDASP